MNASSPAATSRGSLLTGRGHRSSRVAAGLVLLFLVFCNLPGQLCVDLTVGGLEPIACFTHFYRLEHGWPATWLWRREQLEYYGFATRDLNPADIWAVWTDVDRCSLWILGLNVLACAMGAWAGGAAFELWRRGRHHLWQLHLRDLAALLTLTCLFGAWYAKARRQQLAEHALLGNEHEAPLVQDSDLIRQAGPSWLRKVTGDGPFNMFDRRVSFDCDAATLPQVCGLPAVEKILCVSINGVNSDQLRCLASAPKLRAFHCANIANPPPPVSLPALIQLRALRLENADLNWSSLSQLKSLEVLDIAGCRLNDLFFEHLAGLKGLRELSLSDNDMDVARLTALSGLPRLRRLRLIPLAPVPFGDDVLEAISGCRELRELDVWNCRLTSEGLRQLSDLRNLESLSLGFSEIDDDVWAGLAAVPSLHHLAIMRNSPAINFSALQQMKQLRKLELPRGSFKTPEEREAIEQVLPNCKVEFPSSGGPGF